jgi:predicted transcriptional regulator
MVPLRAQITPKRSYKKHRSKEEIVANVLKASRNSATKTRIMRTCYISYHLLQKYLGYATVKGLLFRDPASNKYHITSKGIQYLDYFDEYVDTESMLVHKRRLISTMLEDGFDSRMPNFRTRSNAMLMHTAA